MTLVDEAARAAIRGQLDRTFVVEAAAGTGKTTALIGRIIAIVATGTSTLARLVAVTFTEKAAGEMKLRLRTELEQAFQAATGATRARLAAALEELEVTRIGTIHSFCTDLLRERPLEAGIDPMFETVSDDGGERIVEEAFQAWSQRTLARPGEGVRRLLRRARPLELLRGAALRVLENRDFTNPWRRDPFARDAAIDALITELGELGALAAQASSASDPLAKHLAQMDVLARDVVARERVRPRDHDGLEVELGQLPSRWRFDWQRDGRGALFGPGLARVDLLARRAALLANLRAFGEASEADLAPLLRAELASFVDDYEQAKRRRGVLDFQDLLIHVRALLRDAPAVRREMQARFTHFFVDEFQDTDPLQVDILLLLAADDPAVAEPRAIRVAPGKLFIVGDPKQAIYRFRRADIAMYEGVKQRLLAQGATLLHLVTNFRSALPIQQAVNASFAPVMRGDGQAAYVALAPRREALLGQPAVVALPVPEPYNRRIANVAIEKSYPEAVAAWVAHVLASGWRVSEPGVAAPVPVAARHVCLIFRRFHRGDDDLTLPYVRALEARGLAHILVGGRSLHDREEVEAMRNAAHAIEWPDDEFSVYATLRGPLFGFHDEDLLAYKAQHRRLEPLARSLGADAIGGALGLLGELHRRRNRRTVADTLARLLAATRAHAGLAIWSAGDRVLANVARVLDIARRFEAGGATSFRAFVEQLDARVTRARGAELPVVEEGADGVRLMTVHGAKGLEFPIVVLCDPTAPLRQERPSAFVDAEAGVWLEALARNTPVELRERAELVLRRDEEEGQRLAYVAATRARDVLVVPVIGDDDTRGGWLAALTPSVYPDEARRRTPSLAAGCPPFGDDSVLARPPDLEDLAMRSVAPGQHAPRAGEHAVVWWDPHALQLDVPSAVGLRQARILEEDQGGSAAREGVLAHQRWDTRRQAALARGATPSVVVAVVTDVAQHGVAAGPAVQLERVVAHVANRPSGKQFGSLVHAVLATVDLDGDDVHLGEAARAAGRLLGSSADELAAVVPVVRAGLAHPVLRRAAAAARRGALRREAPVTMPTVAGLVEGVVDLAFVEPGAGGAGDAWIVVELKTDAELGAARATYEAQVQTYAQAIAAATGLPATPILLVL